jgi:plasmid stabilization system protein ParE
MEGSKVYKITFRKRAAKEYIEAISWYNERSIVAAENFIKAVNEAFSKIEAQPHHYRNSYKNFHELRLNKFPFAIIYFIDEEKTIIVITTIFHHKRNPDVKFGK